MSKRMTLNWMWGLTIYVSSDVNFLSVLEVKCIIQNSLISFAKIFWERYFHEASV